MLAWLGRILMVSALSGAALAGCSSGDGDDDGPAGSGGAGGSGGGGAGSPRCPAGPFGSPLPSNPSVQAVAGVPPADTFNENNGAFGIIEGPVWIGDALYVSEIGPGQNPPPSRILKITPSGSVTVARSDAGTNGLAVDASGKLYGASHRVGGLVRIDLGATEEVLVNSYEGARLNSPNDLAIRSDGVVYFTDPSYQAPTPEPQSATRLYGLLPGSDLAALADLDQPNGVTLSLDEKSLYVSTTRTVYRYPVNADGSLGTASTFAEGGSDGMGIDCAGNVYVTRGSEVIVLSPQGSELGRISVPGVQSVTNVAFGGAAQKTLYVTALGTAERKGLFQVELEVPGLPY